MCHHFLDFVHFTLKIGPKMPETGHFSFFAITFDIIKLLTSSFHGWVAFLRLCPGTPNMSIFVFIFMIPINVINYEKQPFWSFMVFMITIKIKLNIDL